MIALASVRHAVRCLVFALAPAVAFAQAPAADLPPQQVAERAAATAMSPDQAQAARARFRR